MRDTGVYTLRTWALSLGPDCSQSDFVRQEGPLATTPKGLNKEWQMVETMTGKGSTQNKWSTISWACFQVTTKRTRGIEQEARRAAHQRRQQRPPPSRNLDEHRRTHLLNRSWCSHCVADRGPGTQSGKRRADGKR